jgi:predicted membrane-bound spermidine synthase
MSGHRISLFFIAFICGAVVMAFEILGSRVMASTFGNDLFVWGSLIGMFLAGLALGYYLGGYAADKYLSVRYLAYILLISGLLLLVFPFYAYQLNDFVFNHIEDPRGGPLVSSFLLFFIPTVLLGMVSPYCIKLMAESMEKLGSDVGRIYAISTAGSILGTLGTAFYLILWLGTKSAIWMLGLTVLVTGIYTLILSRFDKPISAIQNKL